MTSMPVAGIRAGAPAQPADLVLRNAKIFTGDPKRPAAAALAVRNGSVTVIGGDREVAPLVGPQTRVIDALGHRVVPGLNDSHNHVVRGGLHFVLELRWDGVRTLRGWRWCGSRPRGGELTWAAADFENFAQPRPELGPYEPEFEKAVRLLTESGWGFRWHATYDETVRRDLAVFEKLAAEGLFPGGNRWLFDQVELVSEQSLDRIAALGGAIGVQNRLAYQGTTFRDRYGFQAAAVAPPLGAIRSRGLNVAAGTDATRVSTCNPWVALYWLVSGCDVAGVPLRPRHNRMDRAEALASYTTGGARLTGERQRTGRAADGHRPLDTFDPCFS